MNRLVAELDADQVLARAARLAGGAGAGRGVMPALLRRQPAALVAFQLGRQLDIGEERLLFATLACISFTRSVISSRHLSPCAS